MPITGPGSYLPTIDEFIAHWTNVDALLGDPPLSLNNGYDLADLTADRATLATKITAVNTLSGNVRGASEARDLKRELVREKMRQFNQSVRGLVANKVYIGLCPSMPTFTSGVGKWQVAVDQMFNCWTRVNTDSPAPSGFTPPLLLSGSYALATFSTDKTALLAAFTSHITAFENFQGAVTDRDAKMEEIRERLVQYRAAVQGTFDADSPLIASLPALTPPRGSTPDGVNLTAVWNPTTLAADLSWPAVTDPKVTQLQVRACFGTAYSTAEEEVLDTLPLGTLTYSTDEGLGASGAFITVKVYTMTATGNEKGSNAVKVTRV